jgi:hypothetical protein
MLDKIEDMPRKDIIQMARTVIDSAIEQIEAILSVNGGEGISHYSVFILCSCLIDWLAGYRYEGIPIPKDETKNAFRYKSFIRDYLSKVDNRYVADDLYHNLRCGLVHQYTEAYKNASKFLFTHDPHLKPTHLKSASSGKNDNRKVLYIYKFFEDIKNAAKEMINEAQNNPDILKHFELRIKEVGILSGNIKIRGTLTEFGYKQDGKI